MTKRMISITMILVLTYFSPVLGQPEKGEENLQKVEEKAAEMRHEILKQDEQLRMRQERETELRRAEREIRRVVEEDRLRHREMLRNYNPERYEREKQIAELDKKSYELARAHREAAKEVDKKNLGKELDALLDKLFELRERTREEEIKRLEEDLKKAKEMLITRRSNKDSIIEKRKNQLLGRDDVLDW